MLKSNSPVILPISPSFQEAHPHGSSNRGLSVLFVDESPALANLICMYLDRNGGMNVDTSQSFEDAMNKLRYIAYDVIITDYNNNKRDGNALLRNIRAMGDMIPFVYFVVSRNNEYENEAKQFGHVSFIEKMGSSGANLAQLHQAVSQAALESRIIAVVRSGPSAVGYNESVKS